VRVRKSAIGILVLVALTLTGQIMAQDSASTLKNADAAFAERNYDTARSLYERAIREGASLDSDLSRARNLATAYLNANPSESAKSIQWLQAVVRLDPQADGMRLQLCKLLLNTGDTGGAVQQYRQLVDKHPQSSEYVLALTLALRQDGKSDAALRLLKDTVDHYPNLNVVRLEYARSLNFAREFSEARRQFSKVLDNDPNDLIAQVGMAKSMSYDGDQEGALVEYDKILLKHPGLYDAMIGKAFALLWSGHTDEARELLQKGLARHPDDREVRDALNSLPRANGSAQSVSGAAVVAATVASVANVPSANVAPANSPVIAVPQGSATRLATEPPRGLTPPRSEKIRTSAAKGSKASIRPEYPSAPPEIEPKAETAVPMSGPPIEFLYAIFAIAVALLAFAGVKLWSMQQSRKFEDEATAPVVLPELRNEFKPAPLVGDEFAPIPVNPDIAPLAKPEGTSRRISDLRLSDVFTPISNEPMVEKVTPPVEIAATHYEAALAEFGEVPEAFDEMFVVPPPVPLEPIAEIIPITVVPTPIREVVVPVTEVEAKPMAVEIAPVEVGAVAVELPAASAAKVETETIRLAEPAMIMPMSDLRAMEERSAAIADLATGRTPTELTEVLIVGGLASVVQLQLRWLSSQIAELKPLLERDWATATMRLSTNPPAIIILNSSSDDRWTSMRMFAWITSSYPELRRRVIAVTTADNCPVNTDDLVICEPIDLREWQQKISAALAAANDELGVASMQDAVRFDGSSARISAQH